MLFFFILCHLDALACPQVTPAFSLYIVCRTNVFIAALTSSRNSGLSPTCLRSSLASGSLITFCNTFFAVESGCLITASDYLERYDDICNIFGEHGRTTDSITWFSLKGQCLLPPTVDYSLQHHAVVFMCRDRRRTQLYLAMYVYGIRHGLTAAF